MRRGMGIGKLGLIGVVCAMMLTACSGKGDSGSSDAEGKNAEPPKPVKLNFFYNGYSETLVAELKKQVEGKYPHITLNMIIDSTTSTIEQTIAAGTNVDLVSFSMGGLFKVMDLQLSSDMTELVKKHNFDLSRLSPGVLDTVKAYSEKGELLVMPYELNNSVLLYNKNIFNKFGVPYPKEGMTWDDLLDIVKKTSRVVDGVTYSGFAYVGANPVYKNQMGLAFVDPKTNKATINNDKWKRWLEVMTSFYKVTNNPLPAKVDDMFFKDQTMATRTGPSPLDTLLPAAIENGLDWDAVSLPRFSAAESSGSQMNAPFYAIPPGSSNKDEAFNVIAFLLSDEVQAYNARQGRVPVVKSEAVVKDYGSDLAFLKGKNYSSAVFKEILAKPITVTKFDGIARTEVATILSQLAVNKFDVNTAMRNAEEAANKKIADAQR